jgi:DUF2914 family protein
MTDTPEDLPPGWFKAKLNELNRFRQRHELAEIVIVFVAGFIFDVATLSRVDDATTLIQQGVYLLLLGTLMALEQRQALKGDLPRPVAKVMELAEAGIHFFLGALLSTFTLNYFKSGSGITSLLFVVVAFVLLVSNEFPRFRAYGQIVRFALLSFCLLSYFACVIPVLVGQVRPWMFVLATVLSSGLMGGIFYLLNRWNPLKRALLTRSVLPGMGVQVVLLALYFLKIIPPVPLALTYIGIYHYVEQPQRAVSVPATGPGSGSGSGGGKPGKPVKQAMQEERFVTDRQYRLLHQRPWWRFWEKGDQTFYARDGDLVYCFVSVFAPNKFQDRLNIIWSRYDEARGDWLANGTVPLQLGSGGAIREAGWRTFSTKSRYVPGDWRVEAQTEDGRTIGSIRFSILKDTRTEPRQFVMDLR